MSVLAWDFGCLVAFVDPLAPCAHMRCLMDNKVDNLGHLSGYQEGPFGVSVLSGSVVVVKLHGCGGRGHKYNLWDRK